MSRTMEVAPGPRPTRRPISRAQIEVVASRSVAVFGLLFGAQTFPVMMGQQELLHPLWFWMLLAVNYGSLLVNVVAAFVKRGVRAANTLVAAGWWLSMVLWPFAVVNAGDVADARPWLWFMCTVATAGAAIAFPVRMATVYLLVAPLTYGVVRLFPSGGAATLDLAFLDATYAIMLGGAVLIIITLLRQAASLVDVAQSTALDRYARAVRQHAIDAERVHVDALVHDSVLTTLLEAARARTRESMELVASMSARAMGHLREALESTADASASVTVASLVHELEETVSETFSGFELRAPARDATPTDAHADADAGKPRAEDPAVPAVEAVAAQAAVAPERLVPEPVADALGAAMVQAMVNSVQHAGDAERWVSIHTTEDGVRVEVGDSGVGFDVAALTPERLGIRVSILERVAGVGGSARVDSSPGKGTVVTIEWPEQ